MSRLFIGAFIGGAALEVWDIVVIGSSVAAMRAAISAKSNGASILLLSDTGMGVPSNSSDPAGLAASMTESSTRGHRDDTIRHGDFLCDQDIVSITSSTSCNHVAELERWGLIFRRNSEGVPRVEIHPGHQMPRATGTGDTTQREIYRILNEQCNKYSIPQRTDVLVLEIIQSDNHLHGVVILDFARGEVSAIQSKALIIADDTFEGAWSGNEVGGWGMQLASDAGIMLRDLEFQAWNPMVVENTNLVLPLSLLSNGAKLLSTDGIEITGSTATELAMAMNQGESNGVVDARELDPDSKVWFEDTNNLVKSRTGIDIYSDVIPVTPSVELCIGGIPIDEHGRVILGNWTTWFTGLYAAGDAACSGLNGASLVSGNRLLDSLTSGAAAGKHAAEWVSSTKHSGNKSLEEAMEVWDSKLQSLEINESEGSTLSEVRSSLSKELSANLGFSRNQDGLETALINLTQIIESANELRLDDNTLLMNTNLLSNLKLQAAAKLSRFVTITALQRCESRGSHRRSDYAERYDSDFLKHSLIDSDSNVSWLPIRMSAAGTWILAPK